ncbi:hypothetical protein [Curtobacterium caseinilyticum]|uniref:Uncharacterized protein n=1 Tax=Curtobacterium caseinilyticum TaxID=3055137 RepID=A0ABT7TKS4_9MICO|nr:hypothetical protein [Curtobacterium caseinilyticum]MDM7890131.1 hypothetical protein [Curtobacterium caseinilyticum]
MTVIEDLLAGPRGRRFCWEVVLATVAEPPDDDTLFWADHWITVRQGGGVSFYGPGSAQPRPEPDVRQITVAHEALVHAADPASATLDQALAALRLAADSARWWQEPDAVDVRLGSVVPRTLLVRVATAVAGSPGVQALLAPSGAAKQWVVAPDSPWEQGPERPASELLAEWRRELVAERAHGTEDPVDAPISGTWWTSPPGGLVETTTERGGRGPFGLWAVEDHTGWERADVSPAAVDPTARVLTIDDAEDWAALCRRFPLDVTATTRRHDWYRATGRVGAWVVPDWTAVAEQVDAVRLTLLGWLRASGTAVPVDDRTASVIAGWTPDTTAWLHDPRPSLGPSSTWVWSDDRAGWFSA